MLVDLEKVSAESLKNIMASKRALDAALKARAAAEEEINRCKANLRGLGVGVDGEMPAAPTPGVRPNGGGVRKARPPRARRVPRAPRGIDPAVVETVRTCLGDTLRSAPEIASITGLHVGVVRRVLAHLNAGVSGQGRATRYYLPDGAPRAEVVALPDEDPEDEPAAGDAVEEDDDE